MPRNLDSGAKIGSATCLVTLVAIWPQGGKGIRTQDRWDPRAASLTIRPQGVILLGNRPPGESSPWGIVPQGNHPPGESFPWGITPLGNRPPGGSPPWGITPYVPPWLPSSCRLSYFYRDSLAKSFTNRRHRPCYAQRHVAVSILFP